MLVQLKSWQPLVIYIFLVYLETECKWRHVRMILTHSLLSRCGSRSFYAILYLPLLWTSISLNHIPFFPFSLLFPIFSYRSSFTSTSSASFVIDFHYVKRDLKPHQRKVQNFDRKGWKKASHLLTFFSYTLRLFPIHYLVATLQLWSESVSEALTWSNGHPVHPMEVYIWKPG